MRRENILTSLIVLGLLGGLGCGQLLFYLSQQSGEEISSLWRIAGELVLVKPLMLLIMPLILVSVIVGVTSIGDPSRLGVIGGATLLYFLTTMILAVVLGAILVTTIRPGTGLSPEAVASLTEQGDRAVAEHDVLSDTVAPETDAGEEKRPPGLGEAWMNIINQLLPRNVFAELSAGRPLGVITFGILLGLALALGGETTAPAIRVAEGLFDAIMRLVGWVIWLTPLGVFFLVTAAVGKVGLASLAGPLGKYMLTVLIGLLLHATVMLPIVLAIFGTGNPYRWLWRARRAIMTALGTSSSSATMPVTLEVATTNLQCSRRASNFVIPLGTTVNMDGTALYEAVAVVFLFQLYGIDLAFGELLIVIITATLAAVGAAGIPSAGLVTMVIVISAVNTSLAGRGVPALPLTSVGIILGVDRILDMCRTATNVWGDMTGAKIVTRLAPD